MQKFIFTINKLINFMNNLIYTVSFSSIIQIKLLKYNVSCAQILNCNDDVYKCIYKYMHFILQLNKQIPEHK